MNPGSAIAHSMIEVALTRLIGATSGDELLRALSELLGDDTRLALVDNARGTLYPVLGGGEETDLVSALAQAPNDRHVCRFGDDVVGVLYSRHTDAAVVVTVLGPALVNLQGHDAALARLSLAEEKNRLLLETGALLRGFELDTLLVKALETALAAVRAELGVVLLPGDDGRLAIRSAWGLTDAHVAALRLRDGTGLGDATIVSSSATIFDRARIEREFDLDALGGLHLSCLLAVPLTVGAGNADQPSQKAIGAMLLINAAQDFTDRDRELAELVCRLGAIALDNARLVQGEVQQARLRSELDIAQRVQLRMFPASDLTHAGITVAGASRPCDETGGDYYQFQVLDRGVLTMIGDVSGHGLGAALYTTMAHAAIFQSLRAGTPLDAAFAQLSANLASSALDGNFMTACIAIVDPITHTAVWTNAGHNPPLLIRADGQTEWLDSQGFPLGMFDEASYDLQTLTLAPGDCVVFYTDGVTECHDGADQFGEERLRSAAIANRHLPAQELVRVLLAELDRFAAGRHFEDDVTVVVLKT